MNHAPTFESWLGFVVPLAIGVSAIVIAAAVIARCLRLAAWKRIAWQVSTLAIAILLASEVTGVAGGVMNRSVGWWRELGAIAVGQGMDVGEFENADRDWPVLQIPDAGLSPEISWPSHGWIEDAEYGEHAAAQQELRPPVDSEQNLAADHSSWLPAMVWVTGTALLLGRLAVGWWLLATLRWLHRSHRDEACGDLVQAMARRLGIAQRIDVVQSRGLCGPIAFGTLRPTIGLPHGFTEQFDRSQQEAMLAHELGHLAAHDPAWQTFADVVAAALWWHPLVWWSRHELRSASELAADDASLAIPGGPASLAACLVAVGGRLVRRRSVGWTGIEGNGFRSSLGRRVERLLAMASQPWSQPCSTLSRCFKVVGPMAMVAVAMASTAWSRPQDVQKGDSMSQSIRHSWRHSLAAVTFVSLFGAAEATAIADDPPETPTKVAPAPVTPTDETEPGETELIRLGDSLYVVAQKEKPSKEPRGEKEAISDAVYEKLVKAKERLGQLEREIEELRAAGKTDQAEKLITYYKELRGQLEASQEKKGEKSAEGSDDLKARLKALEAENAKLRELLGGKEKSKGEEQHDPKAKYPVKSPPEKPVPHKIKESEQEVQFKLKAMQAEIAELAKAGRKDEAEKLAAAARELAEHAKHAASKFEIDISIPAEVKEKFEVAAKDVARLQQAGKHEEAQELARKLQSDARQYHESYKRKLIDKGFAPMGAESHELGQVINQLREEVMRLREEVNDLRRAMKERGDDKPVGKSPR
jgi:hypothetical protein